MTFFLDFGFCYTAWGMKTLIGKKEEYAMGDKGRKDKNKHDKQADKAKNEKNEANRKKQEHTHL